MLSRSCTPLRISSSNRHHQLGGEETVANAEEIGLDGDTGLPCDFVPDLGAALLQFRPGDLLRRGERLLLCIAGGGTVDARGWRDDVGFLPSQQVQFPCHIARVATPGRGVTLRTPR